MSVVGCVTPYSITAAPLHNESLFWGRDRLEETLPGAFDLQGLLPNWSGANCFNTVLYLKGFANLRFSSADEFRVFVESSLCRQLDRPEEGAVGLIRTADTKQDVHAFIYLDAETVFQKLAEDVFGRYPIGLAPFKSMEVYDYPRSQAHLPQDQKTKNRVTYYTCENFVRSTASNEEQAFDQLQKSLEKLLFDAEAAIGRQDQIDSARARVFFARAEKIERDLEAYQKQVELRTSQGPTDELMIATRFLEKRRQTQTAAILTQIYRIEESLRLNRERRFGERVKALRQKLRQIESVRNEKQVCCHG